MDDIFVTFPTCQITEAITIRDLLSHRVCLVDDPVTLTVGSDDDTRKTYADRIRYLTKRCDFRTKYTYRNGVEILALSLCIFLTFL